MPGPNLSNAVNSSAHVEISQRIDSMRAWFSCLQMLDMKFVIILGDDKIKVWQLAFE